VTDRRILVLRTVLLWILLEVLAAAQVRSATGELLISTWTRTVVSPIVWTGERIGELVHDALVGISSTARLAVDNRRLRFELETAEALQLVLAEDAAAAREAAELIHRLPRIGDDAIPARAIHRNLARGSMIVEIDRRRQVVPDTPVVATGGIAGRVIRCSGRRCWIELITHPVAAVAVRTPDGLVEGLAVGGTADRLEVQFVPRQAALLRGTELVSSGADGIYPPGLPVCRITSVRERADAFLDVRAEPIASLATIRAVILLDRTPTAVEYLEPVP
jgi:rod shape-determining protein MreC